MFRLQGASVEGYAAATCRDYISAEVLADRLVLDIDVVREVVKLPG